MLVIPRSVPWRRAEGEVWVARPVGMDPEQNIIIKGYETGEHGPLLPVLAMLLGFAPAELAKLQKAEAERAKKAAAAAPATPGGLWLFRKK